MWICHNQGFISIVESREPDVMMVRARKWEHLRDIFGPHERIHVTPNNDYRFRVFVPRTELAELLAQMVIDVDYTNFKNSVVDDELHDLYAKFWQLHFWFQQKIYPYTRNRRKHR